MAKLSQVEGYGVNGPCVQHHSPPLLAVFIWLSVLGIQLLLFSGQNMNVMGKINYKPCNFCIILTCFHYQSCMN